MSSKYRPALQENEQLKADKTELIDRLGRQLAENADMSDKVKSLDKQIIAEKSWSKGVYDDMTELNTQLDQKDQKIREVNQQMVELKKKITQLTEANESLRKSS